MANKYRVIGAAAVVRSENKSERYLYRDAVFDDDGLDPANIEHLLGVRLIEKVEDAVADETGDEAAAGKAAADAAAKK